jgi:hypothetical protein
MPVDSRRGAVMLTALLLLVCAPHRASADGWRAPRAAAPPAYQQECGACHLAYPPGLLPAESWQRLMSQLPQHFGVDASLDAAAAEALSGWLKVNAATSGRVAQQPAQDRITRSAWFVRKHDEVAASTWTRPAVKSPANCTACHTQADQGDFSEHRVHIPR